MLADYHLAIICIRWSAQTSPTLFNVTKLSNRYKISELQADSVACQVSIGLQNHLIKLFKMRLFNLNDGQVLPWTSIDTVAAQKRIRVMINAINTTN